MHAASRRSTADLPLDHCWTPQTRGPRQQLAAKAQLLPPPPLRGAARHPAKQFVHVTPILPAASVASIACAPHEPFAHDRPGRRCAGPSSMCPPAATYKGRETHGQVAGTKLPLDQSSCLRFAAILLRKDERKVGLQPPKRANGSSSPWASSLTFSGSTYDLTGRGLRLITGSSQAIHVREFEQRLSSIPETPAASPSLLCSATNSSRFSVYQRVHVPPPLAKKRSPSPARPMSIQYSSWYFYSLRPLMHHPALRDDAAEQESGSHSATRVPSTQQVQQDVRMRKFGGYQL